MTDLETQKDPLGGAIGAAERQARADALDETRSWVDPNGYRLSDRVWLAGQNVRQAIDHTLREAIVTGESPLLTARKLEQWLSPTWAPHRDGAGKLVTNQPKRLVTQTPGLAGRGSHAARRLARTEVTRAHGRATIAAAQRNPFARGVRWMLSAGHKDSDACDRYASHDEGLGRGVYPARDVPSYPQHPHERCVLAPSPVADPREVVAALRSQFGLDGPPATGAALNVTPAAARQLADAANAGRVFKDKLASADELFDRVPREVYREFAAKTDAGEYVVERVPVRSLIGEAETYDADRILAFAREATIRPADAPVVLRYAGDDYLIDGHHRALSRLLRGEDDVVARVFDMGSTVKAEDDVSFLLPKGRRRGRGA